MARRRIRSDRHRVRPIAALIAVVVITAVTTIGANLKGTFNNVANGVK